MSRRNERLWPLYSVYAQLDLWVDFLIRSKCWTSELLDGAEIQTCSVGCGSGERSEALACTAISIAAVSLRCPGWVRISR